MPPQLLDQNEANNVRQHQVPSAWNSHLQFSTISFQPTPDIVPDSALAGHPSSPHVPPACPSLQCSQLLGLSFALYVCCGGRELKKWHSRLQLLSKSCLLSSQPHYPSQKLIPGQVTSTCMCTSLFCLNSDISWHSSCSCMSRLLPQ